VKRALVPAAMLAAVLAVLHGGCSEGEDPRSSGGGAGGPHFTDVTDESGLEMVLTSGEDPPTRLFEVKGNGVALIDFDQDGDPDVFVPNGATISRLEEGPGARLFENLGGMRFQDVTANVGLDFHRFAYGCAQGDVDGDGFIDLFVTCYGRNALLRNRGGKRFEEVTEQAGIRGDSWSSGSCFGDIDGDGDLDLYVVNYAVLPATGPAPQSTFMGAQIMGGPMGLPAVPDQLYQNQGDGTFRDVSEASGILVRPPSYGLGAVMLDFDGDQKQDIYVGNDSRASFLLRGKGDGTFEEIGELSGVAFDAAGAGQATMGIAVGDVDGNGLPDLFTTNFMLDANTLHVNLGDLMFEDRTRAYGLYMGSHPFLSWATSFFDFDHDADEDLIFFNGHIYPKELCDARDWNYRQVPVLYRREAERFERLTAESAGAWLAEPHCDRAAGFGDLDQDGDVDMVVCERNDRVRVLRNDRDGGDWLIVKLEDRRPGRDRLGFGSKISVTAGSVTQHRWIASGVSFLASNEPIAHFGLPPGTDTVRVEVLWTDGERQILENVPARTRQTVTR